MAEVNGRSDYIAVSLVRILIGFLFSFWCTIFISSSTWLFFNSPIDVFESVLC